MTVPQGALCGAVVGVLLYSLYGQLHDDKAPMWLIMLGTAIITLPIVVWWNKRKQ